MNVENTNQENVELVELLIVDIIPSGDNPRVINEKSTEFIELTESIQAQGVIVPIHVRIHPKQYGKVELLAGERRLKASRKAGRDLIPAVNHGKITDEAAFEITFTENFDRKDLTPIEQGKAVVILLAKYKDDAEAVASKMGKSIKWVRQRQALGTKLSQKWIKALAEDSEFQGWTASHLQRIAALPEPTQSELLEEYNYNDQPTLKELDDHIAEILQLLSKAPFDTTTAGCTRCQKRTSCQPGLFDETLEPEALKKNDRCLDKLCWDRKTLAWLREKFEAKKKEMPTLTAIEMGQPSNQWRNVLRQAWPNYLQYYEYKQESKKCKGSVPGFIIYGKAIGTILWIKPTGSAAESRSGKSTGKPTPLKERRDMLNRKRWSHVLRELVKIVETKAFESIVTEFSRLAVMGLAGIFGTWEKRDYLYKDTEGDWDELKKITEPAKTDPVKASHQVTAKLWEEVRPVLTSRLTYNDAITRTPDSHIAEAKTVAGLLGIDIDALFKAAETEYKEAASWAKLNADGTPKKAKKVKEKSTKEKKPTKVRTCRECGCTDDKPCITKEGPCRWAKKDLCSACVPTVKRREAHDKS